MGNKEQRFSDAFHPSSSHLILHLQQIYILQVQPEGPLSDPTRFITPTSAHTEVWAQDSRTSLNPSEDVFGLDHRAHRSLADSHSDMSYFISGFSLLPPHSAVINTNMWTAHIFLTFSALTLFNRVT